MNDGTRNLLLLKHKSIFVLSALLSVCALLKLQGDDAPGSKLYWLLNPGEYIEQNQLGKSILEDCVARLDFVDHARILPKSGSNLIEIDIRNPTDFVITGLLIQPVDDRIE